MSQHAIEQHRQMEAAMSQVYADKGLLDQAYQARAIGDGAFLQFIKGLLAQYGPLIGPILVSLLGNILHLPILPIPTPPAPPVPPAPVPPVSTEGQTA